MREIGLDEYRDRYEHIKFERSDAGVLEVMFHTDGSDLKWGLTAHEEIASAWADVGRDPENRVVIVTGGGKSFIHEGGVYSEESNWVTPEAWAQVHKVGRQLVLGHLDIEVPMIAAVNGHATLHSEQALLCDIVIAADSAIFADRAHFVHGVLPGDGIQVIWPHLIGLNRGRYMMLMGQEFSALEALELGVVNEVVPARDVLTRAHEIADVLLTKPPIALSSIRRLLVGQLRRVMSEEVDRGLLAEGLAGAGYWPTRT